MRDPVQEDKYKSLLQSCVLEYLEAARNTKPMGASLYSRGKVYRVSKNKGGAPCVVFDWNDNATPYRFLFEGQYFQRYPWEESESFRGLAELARQDPRLRRFFRVKDSGEGRSVVMETIMATSVAHDLAECHLETFGPTVNEVALAEWTKEVSESVYSPQLAVKYAVPILMVEFAVDCMHVLPGITLERLPESLQIRRHAKSETFDFATRSVKDAATHALFFHGHHIENVDFQSLACAGADPSNYPLRSVDNFMAAIRACTIAETGYWQLLTIVESRSSLLQGILDGVAVGDRPRYPAHFPYASWAQPPTVVSDAHLDAVVDCFHKLEESNRKDVQLAVRCLNRCYLRDDEDDAIIDAATGLEALVLGTDGNKGEVTYKLRMRLAALSKLMEEPRWSPSQIFKVVGDFYRERSHIVHGTIKAGRTTHAPSAADPPCESVARTEGRHMLRAAVRAILNHPEIAKAGDIDELVLRLIGEVAMPDVRE